MMSTDNKIHLSEQARQSELDHMKEKTPHINKKGNRIKVKGLSRSILKYGMLYTALPLLLLYWGNFYLTSDASHFPKALIYSLIIFPPLSIIIGYALWLIKNLKNK